MTASTLPRPDLQARHHDVATGRVPLHLIEHTDDGGLIRAVLACDGWDPGVRLLVAFPYRVASGRPVVDSTRVHLRWQVRGQSHPCRLRPRDVWPSISTITPQPTQGEQRRHR